MSDDYIPDPGDPYGLDDPRNSITLQGRALREGEKLYNPETARHVPPRVIKLPTSNPAMDRANIPACWLAENQKEEHVTATAVTPTDECLQALAETEDEWSVGAAWYGEHGRYSEMRDILLATIGERVKLAWPSDEDAKGKDKFSEAAVTRRAQADPEYRVFVESHLEKRIAWNALNERRQRLWADYWRLHAEAKNARFAGAA